MEIMKWNRSSSGHFSETLAYLSLGPGFPLSLNDGWCAQWWTTFQKVSKVLSDIQRGTNKTHTRCNSSSSPIHDHKHNLTTSWYTITSGSTNTFIRAPMLTTTQIWKRHKAWNRISSANPFPHSDSSINLDAWTFLSCGCRNVEMQNFDWASTFVQAFLIKFFVAWKFNFNFHFEAQKGN